MPPSKVTREETKERAKKGRREKRCKEKERMKKKI